jgi:hypothetical protein
MEASADLVDSEDQLIKQDTALAGGACLRCGFLLTS